MGKEQVDEKHEIKFFEIIYKLIEFVSALCLCGQVIIISIAVIGRYIFSYTPTWSGRNCQSFNGVDVFSHSQHGN